MNVRDFECRSYERAMELLGDKVKRTVCNNTELVGSGVGVWVRVNGHCIVELRMNGEIVLDSCGHPTMTTKDRINRCLPYGWKVGGVKGEWRLWNWYDLQPSHRRCPKRDVPFVDGMTVSGTETEPNAEGGSDASGAVA